FVLVLELAVSSWFWVVNVVVVEDALQKIESTLASSEEIPLRDLQCFKRFHAILLQTRKQQLAVFRLRDTQYCGAPLLSVNRHSRNRPCPSWTQTCWTCPSPSWISWERSYLCPWSWVVWRRLSSSWSYPL